MLLLVVLHFLPLSNLFPESKVKESQTKVVLYNVGIRGRTIFFTHFVDRGQAENEKGEMFEQLRQIPDRPTFSWPNL
ncbi:hypothetical protein ACSQ67_001847 [Phaseolus vulgaris]